MVTKATTRVRRTVSLAGALPLPPRYDHDRDWAILMASVQTAYHRAVSRNDNNLFQTDASGLFTTFLFHIPEQEKQIHTCRTCRRFYEAFGGLVTIDEDGDTKPVFWEAHQVPEFYRPAVAAVGGYVNRARVTGVFLSDERISAEISGREYASACGLAIGPPGTHSAPIHVTTDGKTADYVIDRWD